MTAFLNCDSLPRMWTLTEPKTVHFKIRSRSAKGQPKIEYLLITFQMYCIRNNDENEEISQYLGSCVLDISQCKKKSYHLAIRDASSSPPLHSGQISVTFVHKPVVTVPHPIQCPSFARELYSAATANLNWIEGFGSKGLPPIVHGLRLVHSPYYVNYMGIAMPSGAFCMIDTEKSKKIYRAIKSHNQRLNIALSRNTMTSSDFIQTVDDLMKSSIKSKHIRCLAVVADWLTLHTQMDIRYSADVQLKPELTSTERWDIPRMPSKNGGTVFNGDCEDYAREIYQHCKELKHWIKPKLNATALESAVAVLYMYVPTIEQGAVDQSAHTRFITYDAPYRNHIWAAMHPRYSWSSKCTVQINLNQMYDDWPKQKCEKNLPMIHLEGTGEVYPIVMREKPGSVTKPGFIGKMLKKKRIVHTMYPDICAAETPDISLQCDHKSNFYKYPIACMTDAFSDQGILDFTYVTNNKYGVSIYDWARGKYKLRPSCIHSKDTMQKIKLAIEIERPIPCIVTKNNIVKKHGMRDGYALRYGQKEPFEQIPSEAKLAIYSIGGQKWHEVYFPLSGAASSASSNELDCQKLLLL